MVAVSSRFQSRSSLRVWGVFAFVLASVSAGTQAQVGPGGGFGTSIPIAVPAGAGGVQPNLALSYSSGGGNGIAGVGWNLSGLSAISRMPYGDGIKYDGSDTYAGPSGRLVAVGGGMYHGASTDWTNYVPSGTCGDGPCSWTAYLNGGGKLYFGTTADSRIEKKGAASVRLWALAKMENIHGDYYEVSYTEDATNGTFYPTTLTYTKGNGLATFRTVTFTYEARPDIVKRYFGGEVKETSRLKEIMVRSDGQLVRTYALTYTTSPRTGASLLASVTAYGGDGTTPYPTQSFTYLTATGNQLSASSYSHNYFANNMGYEAPDYYSSIGFPDLNGDGRGDICGRHSLRAAYGERLGRGKHLDRRLWNAQHR